MMRKAIWEIRTMAGRKAAMESPARSFTEAMIFTQAMAPTMAILTSDLARLNAASGEANDLWSHLPNRGTILPKSGVMGFTVNRKPTWSTLPTMATMNTMARTGRAIFASQLMKAVSRPPLKESALPAMERKYVTI